MNPAPPVSLGRLLVLVTAVLAAHLLILRAAPRPANVSPAAAAQPFTVRNIGTPPPPTAAAAALQPAALRPAPEARPAIRAPHTARQSGVRTTARIAQESLVTGRAPAQPGPPGAQLPSQSAAEPVALKIPASMRLHYKVTAQVGTQASSAESELAWRHDGASYEASLDTSGALLRTRTQHSMGRVTAEGLAPLRFSDKARSEEAAHFDRDKGKVSFSSNRPDALLLAGAQDRLSVLLQLGAMIAGEPRKFQPGVTISVQTAGTRDAELWLFTVERVEELRLPGGTVDALKLIRSPRREFDQKIELWLAPAMDYVPVRLRLTQPNGDSVDQQWSSTDRG